MSPRFKGSTGGNDDGPVIDLGGGETRKTNRISLPLTDAGTIDWSKVTDKTRNRFAHGVSSDPEAMQLIGLRSQAAEEKVKALGISENDVKDFLDGYAFIECTIIPPIIARKTQGKVQISSDIAHAAFTFTEEQKNKIAPAGAEWANTALPDWLKKFLLDMGAGAKFAGMLAFYTAQQTKTAIALWAKQNHATVNGINGEPVPVATGGEGPIQ